MTDQPQPDLAAIIREHLRELLEADLLQRVGTPPGQPTFTTPGTADQLAELRGQSPREADLEVIGSVLADALEALADRDPRPVAGEVRQLMAEHRLPEDARNQLTVGLLEARVEMLKTIEQRTRGEVPLVLVPEATAVRPVLPPPSAPLVQEVPPEAPAKPPASALIDPFFTWREKRKNTSKQVMNQERATMRRFLEARGDTAPALLGE